MKTILNRFDFIRILGSIFSCMIILFLTSCDPGQTLIIQNNTNASSRVTFVFNQTGGYYVFDEYSDSDTLIVELGPEENNNHKEYFFGIGTWKIQSSMDSLVAMVKQIEIETNKSKEIFQGEQQIRAFFESRITGGYDEIIEIKLE